MKPSITFRGKQLGRRNFVLSVFIVSFGLMGLALLVQSFAAANGTISGVAFKDMNRNGVKDTGEEPYSGYQLYFFDETSTIYKGTVVTDANGNYTFGGFDDGKYMVATASSSYAPLKPDWLPTTTGSLSASKVVTVTNGSATVNFGWRPIVNSTDVNAPISQAVMPSGLTIKLYNDALTPADVYAELQKGGLLGVEQKAITIKIGLGGTNATATGVQGTPGSYTSYNAVSNISWGNWIDDVYSGWPAATLFHEYGHAWDGYYTYLVQQTGNHDGYLKARGLYGDSRINTSYAWNEREMLAEDYRQLFGDTPAKLLPQINKDIPLASQVAGLADYLSSVFTKASTATLTAPTSLTASSTLSTEGPAVNLSWTASTGQVNHYDIYRDGTKVGYANAPTVNFYDQSSLQNSKSYSYYAKAVASDGSTSAASNTVNITTPASDTQVPTAPSGLSSTAKTNSTISLKWTAGTDNVGIKEYRIYQDIRKLQPVLKGTATGTNFTISGLKSSTSYTFYVTALDAAGNESLPSQVINVKTTR